ncbi:hypothetical protein SAMN05660464_0005 [Geodermatophilus dictyosporus]|uniref:Uncharacterized protein n=1 Tax=Geodermatophilus dictyosporus TaxID=1523247 RepID=A0A1I5U2F7_9ACTN|nr:hypothetical protein [Geodermatophilus dictyosporus]SFP89027.1 hypothetical protein SAMN05660464_0005 [Geodermatophilus dictyosporus]
MLFLLSAVISDITSDDESSEAASDTTESYSAPPATGAPTSPVLPPEPEPPGFGDGTYLVGTEVHPGLYRSDGAHYCSWKRLSDLSGDYDAVLAWDYFVEGQVYVEVLPTDVAFTTDDCGRWTAVTSGGPDVSGAFDDGTYLVGSEIQPGTYRSTGGSGCSWKRLADLTGDYDAILASDHFVDGQAYVEISPTDVAFSTDDCGTWSRVS